uniref:C-type lectin domain-containing protein n=1 Tax=Oncorhynchus tshawytscha TaxID=74940 RepID=A0AAZ3P2C6_ONCTS
MNKTFCPTRTAENNQVVSTTPGRRRLYRLAALYPTRYSQYHPARSSDRAPCTGVEQAWDGGVFKSSWYYISTEKRNWEESRRDCLRRGTDLGIINSRGEQVFVNGFWEVWIGLTDRDEERIWNWVDGTPLTTGYWGSRQPNSHLGRNEDCAEKWPRLLL